MKRNKKNKVRAIEASDTSKPTIEGVLDASIATLDLGLTAIRAEIELIVAGKGAKSRHDKGSRIAFLTARVGSIADSIRKVEAARAKRFDDLTPAMVLGWLRQLDPAERLSFLREASQIDARKSGLA
jgi:hypothetical protein